jgi:hypothetical protein
MIYIVTKETLVYYKCSIDGQVQWNEHIALCRSPTSYTTREHVKTAQECKDICIKDRSCLMVKYSKRRRKCWLCDNKSLRPSTKCSAKYDFYIKGIVKKTMKH